MPVIRRAVVAEPPAPPDDTVGLPRPPADLQQPRRQQLLPSLEEAIGTTADRLLQRGEEREARSEAPTPARSAPPPPHTDGTTGPTPRATGREEPGEREQPRRPPARWRRRPPSPGAITTARWLLLGAVGLSGVGQWLLGHGLADQGWRCYLLGSGLFLIALLDARDDESATEGAVRALPSRAIWVSLAIIGQILALQLAQSAHTWWPVFAPWSFSLLAAIASVAHIPIARPTWRIPARFTRPGWRVPERLARWRSMIGPARRLAIGGVIGFAAVARLVDLEGLPRGIHGDEGEFGDIALSVLQGRGPSPFGVAFLGDPALYPHLLAPFIAVLGVNMTAIRLFSALAGIATILIFYRFVRDLGGNRAGLIAATLLAGSAAHLHFSRVALNVVQAPLFVCLSLWLLWKGLTTHRAAWYLGAGITAGIGCYFHFSARIVIPILGLALLWPWLARWLTVRQMARGAALTAVGGLLALSPLIAHTLAAPGQLTEHVTSRLIWNQWPATVAAYNTTPDDWFGALRGQAMVTLASFIARPDPNSFFGFGGVPLVGALVAPFMVLGLVALCARPRTPQAALLLPWFLGPFVFGGVLVIEPGSFHRVLIGLLPALVAAALLLDRLITLTPRWLPGRVGPILAGLLLLLAPLVALQEARGYFTLVDYGLGSITTQARQLEALPPGTLAYVLSAPYVYAEHGPSRYLGHAVERRDLYNPTVALPAQSAGPPLTILVNPGNTPWIPLLRAYYPDARLDEIRWPNGRTYLYTLTVPTGMAATVPLGGGLRGEIRPAPGAPVRVRQDPALAFMRLNELAGTPSYAARWEGRLRPPVGGGYRLEVVTDGAITLRLDDVPVVVSPGGTREIATFTQAGILDAPEYAIALDGDWANGAGHLALYWRRGDAEREIVPPTAFVPAP